MHRTGAAGPGGDRPARHHRQRGALAGGRRGHLRGPARRHRPGAPADPSGVLHLRRRPHRPAAARCAGGTGARRGDGEGAGRRGGFLDAARRVLRAAGRGRRRVRLVPSDAPAPVHPALAQPALPPQDRRHRRPCRLHRRHQHRRRGKRRAARRRLPRPAHAPGRRHRAQPAAGVRRGLGLRHRAEAGHVPRDGHLAGQRAAAPRRPHPGAGAGVRPGHLLGSHPPHAGGGHPRSQAAGVAGLALLRARRSGADGADLRRPRRAGRARGGAADERFAHGHAGGALLLRRADRRRRARLRIRPAHAAHQGAAGGRGPVRGRQRQFRPAQLPAQLRAVGDAARNPRGPGAGPAPARRDGRLGRSRRSRARPAAAAPAPLPEAFARLLSPLL